MTSFEALYSSTTPSSGHDISSLYLLCSPDCSPFLNWDEQQIESIHEKPVIFRSLVATVKFQPALDVFLESKAVKFLGSLLAPDQNTVDAFLGSLGQTTDESLIHFIQSLLVLISSPRKTITTAAMKILENLFRKCSPKNRFTLVKADLIPQIIISLNPLSLPFPETVDIHTCLIYTIFKCFRLATPQGLEELKIEDENEQQAVHKTVFKQVITPSKKYIYHLCVNRFSIVDGEQSSGFLLLLAMLVEMCPFYKRIIELVLNMPVFLTIPSCLTFFENERSIWMISFYMTDAQRKWNKKGGNTREMGKFVHRVLRMEGFEDVLEGKIRNDRKEMRGVWIVGKSVALNNMWGMNLP